MVHVIYTFEVKGDTYKVLHATGKNGYVNVRKHTNNPYKGLGKQFPTFDDAIANYKSADMKVELLKAELGLNFNYEILKPVK